MNVGNIEALFCLFMNHLTSLSCELARLAIYQPREFLSVRANCGAVDIACCKICNNFYYQLFIKINS